MAVTAWIFGLSAHATRPRGTEGPRDGHPCPTHTYGGPCRAPNSLEPSHGRAPACQPHEANQHLQTSTLLLPRGACGTYASAQRARVLQSRVMMCTDGHSQLWPTATRHSAGRAAIGFRLFRKAVATLLFGPAKITLAARVLAGTPAPRRLVPAPWQVLTTATLTG